VTANVLDGAHLIGIGGAGMSGIARILLARGAAVSGSDAKDSRTVLALRAQGALIAIGQSASNVDLLPGGAKVVVVSSAIRPEQNDPALQASRRNEPDKTCEAPATDARSALHVLLR